jgi:hypothetical protein
MQLQKDSEGNVVLCPMADFAVAPVADTLALLAVQYRVHQSQMDERETPGQSQSPDTPDFAIRQVQFVLTQRQAADLAEKLWSLAGRLLEPRTGEQRQ